LGDLRRTSPVRPLPCRQAEVILQTHVRARSNQKARNIDMAKYGSKHERRLAASRPLVYVGTLSQECPQSNGIAVRRCTNN
jgi:hypothetical protein